MLLRSLLITFYKLLLRIKIPPKRPLRLQEEERGETEKRVEKNVRNIFGE